VNHETAGHVGDCAKITGSQNLLPNEPSE